MANSKGSLLAFVSGIAAGTALGLFLASEKGIETRKKVTKRFKELEDDLGTKLKAGFEDLSKNLNGVIDEAKVKVEEAKTKAREYKNSAVKHMKED
jgi:gas vesicle protein